MSGLVDMWNAALAKLREKGGTIFSSGSIPGDDGSTQKVIPAKEGQLLSGKVQAFIQEMRVNSRVLLPRSEASVSMIVEWFSP